MNRKTNQTLVGAALVASLLFAGSSARTLAAEAVVGSARNVTINVVNADIVDVLKALATQTGSNIVAGPETKDKMVTISMKNADLTSALDMVTKLNGLGYKVVDGTYVVASPDRLKVMYPTEGTTEVYTLTSIKPADAVASLAKVAPSVVAQAQGSSMVTLTGDQEDVSNARRLLAQMEGASTAVTGERTTEVYNLKYLNPVEAMRSLAGIVPDVLVTIAPGKLLPGTGEVGSSANGTSEQVSTGNTESSVTSGGVVTAGTEMKDAEVKYNPGEEPRAVLLTGYPNAIAHAVDLLNKLDVAPRQVQITAQVVDLTDNDALDLGLDYTFANLGISESEFADGPAKGFASSSVGRVLSFGQFARLPFKTTIAINALGSKGHSKVLANPTINALDGRPARIFIGDTITYVVSQSVAPTTGQLTLVTEKNHVGITLLVTPSVAGDGNISLEVHPNVSIITGFDNFGVYRSPRISERSVDTTIRMKDGETVAIGGLLRDDEIKTMSRVPILGDIPIFGELFRHRNNTKTHSNVTIFLTAKMVNG